MHTPLTTDPMERSFRTLMDSRIAIYTKTVALQVIAEKIPAQANINDICKHIARLDEAYEKNMTAADRYANSPRKATYARLPYEAAQQISTTLLETAQDISLRYPSCEILEHMLAKHQQIQGNALVMV